jgi:ER membrane protein complex subunit 10
MSQPCGRWLEVVKEKFSNRKRKFERTLIVMVGENLGSQIIEAINVWTVTFFTLYFIIIYVAFHYDLLVERPESHPSPPNTAAHNASDSKIIQFTLQHAFGDSDFSNAGNFSASVITWTDGTQTLTKPLLMRDSFTDDDKNKFQELLKGDAFYRIRVPSNVLNPTGGQHIVSSVKAQCLPGNGLEEHFVIHMEGVNILAANYGAPPGACPNTRQLKLPAKWSFKSHIFLKDTEHAPMTPIFTEEVLGGEGIYVELVTYAVGLISTYWMYLIPLGLIVMTVVDKAVNLPKGKTLWQALVYPEAETALERKLLSLRDDLLTWCWNDF